jgi:hypothetical protein
LCVLTKDRTPNQKHLTLAPRFNANPIILRVHRPLLTNRGAMLLF